MQDSLIRPTHLAGLLGTAFLLVLSLKFYLAGSLDLYSDEIFYWWASTRPALAYSDLPFMTALLAGLGSNYGPAGTLGVRILFLILGSLLPLLIYWLTLPLTNQQQALESAALTLCLPLAGLMGLLAVPEVPLVVFGILSIGFFQRALATDRLRHWVATGFIVALGFSTHYRFFLYPLAALIFLTGFSGERRQWRNGKFWLAVLIAIPGLIPIAWFNLSHQLSSASFYLVERHPWEFQPEGLLHVLKQAAVATPPLYLLCILTLLHLLQQARKGDRYPTLLLTFASVNLGIYLILAPWTDANSTSIHWPLAGYLPLLAAMPMTLRSVLDWCSGKWGRTYARTLVLSIPVLGFTGTLAALVGIGSQLYASQLQSLLGPEAVSNKMAGWKEFAVCTKDILQRQANDDVLIITDNYYTAAQIEFAGISSNTLTLDRNKAVRDGRLVQLKLWGKDSSRLADFAGHPALYINEDSTLTLDDKTALMGEFCSQVESVTPLEQLSLLDGDKRFSYYLATRITDHSVAPAFPCPYPIQAWIDHPPAKATLSASAELRGWAYSEDIGIETVRVLLNGEVAGEASYGGKRPDVAALRSVSGDPNSPGLGFEFVLDTTLLANGTYTLALDLTNRLGMHTRYGEREIIIQN